MKHYDVVGCGTVVRQYHAARLKDLLRRIEVRIVVGPGSAAWTASLAQRLLEGKPLEAIGTRGYSNATYVENTASYLGHVTGLPKAELDCFGTCHYLAEFSSHSWDEFLTAFESAVGRRRVKVEASRHGSDSPLSQVACTRLRQAYRGRMGSKVRVAPHPVASRMPVVPLEAALERMAARLRESGHAVRPSS